MNADQKIAALKPGREVTLTASGSSRVTAERSGDGKTLRIVRHTAGGCEVIRTTKF